MTAGLVHLVQSQNCFRQFNVFGVRTVVFRFMLRLASSVVTHTHTQLPPLPERSVYRSGFQRQHSAALGHERPRSAVGLCRARARVVP